MNLRDDAEIYLSEWRSKLEIIDRAISEEMKRDCRERRDHLLSFLHLEKTAYRMAMAQLNTIFKDIDERENGTEPSLSDIEGQFAKVQERQTPSYNKRIYRIVTWGGIGDALLITPAVRTLKQRYPECKIHVYCVNKVHREVLKENQWIDQLKFVGSWRIIIHQLLNSLGLGMPGHESKLNFIYQRFYPESMLYTNYGRLKPGLFYRESAARIIGEMIGVTIDDPKPDCFLTEEEERMGRRIVSKYPNPVVIHATAASSPNKNWAIENWERLIFDNPDYSFLQLGLPHEELVKGAKDLRGRPIRQSFAILKAARAFIGIDSVLAHAATAFQIPAIVLFGASTPVVWGYDVNQNLYRGPHCSPCIDILGDAPCPYRLSCMSQIKVSDVERALSSYGIKQKRSPLTEGSLERADSEM